MTLSLYLSLLHVINTCLYFVSESKGAAITAFNVRQLQDQVCLSKHTQSEDKQQRKLPKTLHLQPYEQYNMNLYVHSV